MGQYTDMYDQVIYLNSPPFAHDRTLQVSNAVATHQANKSEAYLPFQREFRTLYLLD